MVNLYPRKRLGRLCGAAIFIFVLLAGLVYLVRIGGWTGRPRVHAASV